jgi:hypothetical protein
MEVKLIKGFWTVNKKRLIQCRIKEQTYFNGYVRLIKKYETQEDFNYYNRDKTSNYKLVFISAALIFCMIIYVLLINNSKP